MYINVHTWGPNFQHNSVICLDHRLLFNSVSLLRITTTLAYKKFLVTLLNTIQYLGTTLFPIEDSRSFLRTVWPFCCSWFRNIVVGCIEVSILNAAIQLRHVSHSFLYHLFQISPLFFRVQGTYLTCYKVTKDGILIFFLIDITIIAWSNSILPLIIASIRGAVVPLPGWCAMALISISISFFRRVCNFFCMIFIILRLKWNTLQFRKCFNPTNDKDI